MLDEHARSLGVPSAAEVAEFDTDDIRITKGEVSVFGNAGHFQFVTTKDVVRQIVPIEAHDVSMANDLEWDRRLSELGLMRLSLSNVYCRHLGNSLNGEDLGMLASINEGPQPSRAKKVSASGPFVGLLHLLTKVPYGKRVLRFVYLSLFKVVG